MKKIITLLFSVISFTAFAQQWGPVGCGMGASVYTITTDTASNTVYLGGVFQNLLCPPYYNTVGIASTDGNVLSQVGGYGLRPFGAAVRSSVMFQGKLIIGGNFDTVGTVACKNIAAWDGTQWDTLSSGLIDSLNNPCNVEALAVYNGELYAAGRFTKAGGVPCSNIAKWNGTSWSPVGTGITNAPNSLREVWCMHVFNNQLFVGGYFNNAGGVAAKDIAVWNGAAWDSVGPGLTSNPNNTCVFVWALQDYNNELYAAGQFTLAGNRWRQNIAKWDGTQWDSVSTGLNSGGTARAMIVYRNKLVLGGNFNSLGNISMKSIGAWDGYTWSNIGGPAAFDQPGTEIFSLGIMDSCLYAGGLIDYLYNYTVYSPYLAKYCDASDITSAAVSFDGNGKLAPVPAKDILTFDPGTNEQIQIRIYDVRGKTVLTVPGISGKTGINISGLSPGIYFLENNSSAGSFYYKFIKE